MLIVAPVQLAMTARQYAVQVGALADISFEILMSLLLTDPQPTIATAMKAVQIFMQPSSAQTSAIRADAKQTE
jgi:hypothetical protein